MTGTDLALMRPSGLPAMDTAIDRLYGQMLAAVEGGDLHGLGVGIDSIDRLIDRLDFVRREAGRRTFELLPDQQYRYRGEQRTRKTMFVSDAGVLVEPYLSGGGWRRFDYKAMLKRVLDKAVGLDTRLVNGEGELVGNVETIIDMVCDLVNFSGVKSNAEKHTGLAAHGFDRGDFGEWDEPRKDVRVQRSTTEEA